MTTLRFHTDYQYTDRETKAKYVWLKYQPILRGRKILDVGADECYLKQHLDESASYWGIGLGGHPDQQVDLEQGEIPFPDNSFDVVMAQYVVTAVPNPEAALDEFARVLRPGGELIILTRVSADAGMRRFIEQRLQPVVRPLGFRTAEFAWSRYAKWLAGVQAVELVERRLVPPLGHFSLVRFRKIDIATAA